MNDIRRTILWVIFAFSLVMLWDQWQVHNGKPATFFPRATPAVAGASGAASAPSAVPPASTATAPLPPGAGASAAAPAIPREAITVSTDVLRLTFDSEGGTLVKSEFLKYLSDGATGVPLGRSKP